MSSNMLTSAAPVVASIGPMQIFMKDHHKQMCGRLQELRQQSGLVDLDIVCEEQHNHVHKVILAGASKFFREQLCKANVMVPVIIRLEDFGIDVSSEALGYIIEFAYRGEVVIPGERLSDVCKVVHALGIHGLTDFLPNSSGSGSISNPSNVSGGGGKVQKLQMVSNLTRSQPSSSSGTPEVITGHVQEFVIEGSAVTQEIDGHSEVMYGGSGFDGAAGQVQQQPPQMQHVAQPHGDLPPSNVRPIQQHLQSPVTTAPGYSLVHSQHHDQYRQPTHPQDPHQHQQQQQHHQQQNVIYEAQYMQQQQQHPPAQQHGSGGTVGVFSQAPNSSAYCPSQTTVTQTTTMALQGSYEQVQGQEVLSEDQQQHHGDGLTQGTLGHAQGKLRVINQGMMNATENIQTSEETSNSEAAAAAGGGNCQGQPGSEGQLISPDVCDPNPLANVIETPISSKQLSWLTQPKPPPRAEENASEAPAQATVGGSGSGDVTVSAGYWNLPAPVEEGDDATKKPSDAAVGAKAAASSSSTIDPSFPNWHLLTNVQQQQKQRSGQDLSGGSKAFHSSGNILKNPGSGDNMLAIRSGIPLALQGRRRKRGGSNLQSMAAAATVPIPTLSASSTASTSPGKRTGDLGIRKDLTMPSAPTAEEDNVFEGSDDDDDDIEDSIDGIGLDEEEVELIEDIDAVSPPHQPFASITSPCPAPPSPRSKKRPTCAICSKSFPFPNTLRVHLQQEHSETQCHYCDKEFSNSSVLNEHIDVVHTIEPGDDGDSASASAAAGEPAHSSEEGEGKSIAGRDEGEKGEANEGGGADVAGSHRCLECPMTLASSAQLRQHVRHAHPSAEERAVRSGGGGSVFCPVCKEEGIGGKMALKMHLFEKHGMGEAFRCEGCNFQTPSKPAFTKHACHKTDRKVLKCKHCDKEFKSRVGLELHTKVHIGGEGVHRCTICDFATAIRMGFVKHMANVHKKGVDGVDLEESVRCGQCDFRCVAEFQLKTHVLRCHTPKSSMRFKCTECPYASVEKAALDKHVRIKHTNERPFVCDICGFSTHTQSSIARHRRSHNGDKPYTCTFCDAAYADKKRLQEHILSHTGDRPYKCKFCKFRSKRKENLRNHGLRYHPGNSEDFGLDSSAVAATKKTTPAPSAPTFSPAKEDRSVESSSIAGPSRRRRESNPDGAAADRDRHPSSDNKRRKRSGAASETSTNDNSHIVGHINEDGSIEPVAAAASSSSSSMVEAGPPSTSSPARIVVAVPLEELTYDTQAIVVDADMEEIAAPGERRGS